MDFLTLKPNAFGLDVSELSLKIIKLKKEKKFLGLTSFGEAKINPGIIEEGEVRDPQALAEIIRMALERIGGKKIKTKYVIASLPEEKAFLEVIQMPKMKEEELKKAIYFEAENYIPLPIETVYFDSQIIPPLYNHLDHFDVLISAFPKKIIDSYLVSFSKAGLVPLALEVESQSIGRALVKNGISPVPLLLIDFGAVRTSFIIFSGHSLQFTSSTRVSSNQITQAISQALGINLKEAESLKIKYGIEPDKEGRGKEILDASHQLLSELAKQIEKYLSFYQSHAGHQHLPRERRVVEKVILSGGGANLKGLCDFLSLRLRLPVELGNPWINILPEPLKEVPELSYKDSLKYTTALGLALRGLNH
jgi:type IV pilus assembly protein PilM